MDETLTEFLRKIDRATEVAWQKYWRVNYASAVHPRPYKRMPGIVDVCDSLNQEFLPERIRIVQLVPDQGGERTGELTIADVEGLRSLDVEVLTIDARRSKLVVDPGNVRVLADYFDFS